MYLWKYWRDTGARFIVILTGMVVIWVFYVLFEAHRHSGHAIAAVLYWQDFTATVWMFFPHCLMAMVLAVPGLGEEFAQGTADFLFTRPRSRRYFVWVSWTMGVVQILVIVSVYVLVAFLGAIYISRTVYTWKFLAIVLPVFLMCLIAYGLVYLLATLRRSGRKGLVSALVIVIAYSFLEGSLRLRWNIHLPYPQNLMAPFAYLVRSAHAPAPDFHFPVAAVVGWTLFALACPLVAQLYIQRKEI
jgi:ABC-type transport system involved in multi-copper enzyme maturation permease subunit